MFPSLASETNRPSQQSSRFPTQKITGTHQQQGKTTSYGRTRIEISERLPSRDHRPQAEDKQQGKDGWTRRCVLINKRPRWSRDRPTIHQPIAFLQSVSFPPLFSTRKTPIYLQKPPGSASRLRWTHTYKYNTRNTPPAHAHGVKSQGGMNGGQSS